MENDQSCSHGMPGGCPIDTSPGPRSPAAHDLTVVGCYPPTLGGISVHIQRLVTWITKYMTVKVLDLYSDPGWFGDENLVRRCGRRPPRNLIKAALFLLTNRSRIVHLHTSGLRKLLFVGHLLHLCLGRGSVRILTLHGGRVAGDVLGLGFAGRAMARSVLRQFDHVICVSKEGAEALQALGVADIKITVLPAFLPPTPVASTRIEEILGFLKRSSPYVAVCSGFAVQNYGYHSLFEALQSMTRWRNQLGVILVWYGETDEEYAGKIESMAQAFGNCRIVRDLKPEEFAYLLSKANIYVRPTSMDGDCVAIREAGYLGTQVIASNCVSRPPWVELYSAGNASDLRARMETFLEAGCPRPPQHIGDDGNARIVELYGLRRKLAECGQK